MALTFSKGYLMKTRAWIGLTLTTILFVFAGCGKDQPASGGPAPQSTGNAAQPSTSDPQQVAAIQLLKKKFANSFVIYGDSIFSKERLLDADGNPSETLYKICQTKKRGELAWEAKPDQLTDADKLNGITWRGELSVRCAGASRFWPSYEADPVYLRASSGSGHIIIPNRQSKYPEKTWTDWVDGGFDLRVYAVLKNGVGRWWWDRQRSSDDAKGSDFPQEPTSPPLRENEIPK